MTSAVPEHKTLIVPDGNKPIWFVLITQKKNGRRSLLFGSECNACFQGEEPALLYPAVLQEHSASEGSSSTSSDIPPSVETGSKCILASSPQINSVTMTYQLYSYFIFWLLEQKIAAYPSDLLVSVLKAISDIKESLKSQDDQKIFRAKLEEAVVNSRKVEVGGLYVFSNPKGKTKQTVPGVKKIRKMFNMLRQILFLHLRGGWMPRMNEKIEWGLGSRCRSVLFPKSFPSSSGGEKSVPVFDAGTDGNLVCIMDHEGKGERVYFDPIFPLDLILLMNRIKSRSAGDKYTVGVEDSSIIEVPFSDKDEHLMAHLFTKEKLDKDNRFKQLVHDLAASPEGMGTQRSMPKDTRIITYSEYLFFISALRMCQNLVGVPHDVFDFLYKNYISLCKKYSPLDIIDFLSGKGWKILSRNEGNSKRFIQSLGLAADKYPRDMSVWVHVVEQKKRGYEKHGVTLKEDTDVRFIPSVSKISLMSQILKKEKGFYESFLESIREGKSLEEYTTIIKQKCESITIDIESFLSSKHSSTVQRGKKLLPPHMQHLLSAGDDSYDDDDDSFVASDAEEDLVGSSSDEDSDDEHEKLLTTKNGKNNRKGVAQGEDQGVIMGLFMKAIQTKAATSQSGDKHQQTSAPSPLHHSKDILSQHSQNSIQLPPLLPTIVLADPYYPQPSIPHAFYSQHHDNVHSESVEEEEEEGPHIANVHANHETSHEEDDRWRATLIQKQADFLSANDFFVKHSSATMISYTKHNFAPQLFTQGIAGILRKAAIDEVKARLFIMMIIERKEAEIRHLDSSFSETCQETYSLRKAREVEEDTIRFVDLFIETFLRHQSSISLTAEEIEILSRCYCAYWIFVKQLFHTKEEAFHLQLYESKGWGPILFDTNALILSSCSVVFQEKEMNLNAALELPLQFSEGQNLIASIPSLSDTLSLSDGKRGSIRNQTKNMSLLAFLDAFFTRHSDASYQLSNEYHQGFPLNINKIFCCGSFHLVEYESSCFSDLLYLAALHHLRRGFFLFDCQMGRRQMLRNFLENVCMLKQGVLDFIENLIDMGTKDKKRRITRGYAWLLMIYLKHTVPQLHEKTFNDIMSVVIQKKYIEQILNHSSSSSKTSDVTMNHEGEKNDIEDVFDMQHEMEMKNIEKKQESAGLKGAKTDKSHFVFHFVLKTNLGRG